MGSVPLQQRRRELPTLSTTWGPSEETASANQDARSRHQVCQRPDLGLPAPRTVRNE